MPNKILIVDDEPKNLDVLNNCLRYADFKVMMAKSGEAALKRIAYIKPDLILLDVMMPGIDGFETCRRLKKNEVTKETPVIFITAKIEPYDKVKGFEIGAVDYITKPFEAVEVIARVNRHLILCNLQKQLEAKNAQLQEYVYHLESLATLGKAIKEAQHKAQMMDNAMKVTLSVFNCDRAWLLYPCDPNAPSWRVPIEVTTPEYPGANILNTEIPMEQGVSEVMRVSLSATAPIAFGPKYEHKIAPLVVKPFSVQSQLCLAIHPKIGKPWLFGLHQCSYARAWTENELNLFRDFGQHISESLGLFLSLKELQKSEKQFRGYFESALVGLAITSLKKGWIYANNCVCDMLGYSWEELKKFSWAELTYPDDLAADVAQFEQLLAGKIDSYTMDKRFIHKNGSIVYAFISVTARYQKNGTIDYIVATLQDITARKQAEEVVQKERDKSLSILNAIPSGVYIASKQYDLEYVNQVIEKKLGPFNGRKCYAYFHDRTEICPWCKNEKVLAGESVRWDWYLPKNDKCYDLFDAPIKNVDGSISKIEIIHDITERKQAEIALIQAKKEADSANQAKSTFLSNMSHELRTPLNAILGFAQILHHSHTLPSEHQENVKIINRSGEHLLSLINDVLDMSKIEAGKIILDEQNFDLHHLLNEVHDLFHLKAKEKNLQLLVEQSGVQRYICTDGTKLRQVLLNLLSNAMKFTQEGGVSVYVDEIPIQEKSENTHLHFRVEDTGAGVAEAELDKLFEAFSQTATGKASQQGTGLGLPISRKFVQLMGGDISVKSTVGKGTQFKFSIRAKKVNAADIVDKQSPARQVIALEPNQPRYRILIVDDKWDNRQLLIQLLNPLGFELKEAENGEEAIEIWEKWQPHLIWMDLRMPVLDGLEATKQIKSTPQGAETAIITLTASILEEEKQNVLAAGCDEFLRKPFKNADIFDLMHKHIGVRYVYEESTESVPESTEALTPESLAVLPSELLIDLKKAAASSNMKKVNRLIEEIRKKHHKGLGNALAILGNEFRYEEIVALIVDDIKGF